MHWPTRDSRVGPYVMVSYQVVTATDALRLPGCSLYFDCSVSCVTHNGSVE